MTIEIQLINLGTVMIRMLLITTLFSITSSLTNAYTSPPFIDENEQYSQLARKEFPTNTLYELWLLSKQDKQAAETFFSNLKQKHIIEPIENDKNNVLVTYFSFGSNVQGT